jgi:hypothetical protein
MTRVVNDLKDSSLTINSLNPTLSAFGKYEMTFKINTETEKKMLNVISYFPNADKIGFIELTAKEESLRSFMTLVINKEIINTTLIFWVHCFTSLVNLYFFCT